MAATKPRTTTNPGYLARTALTYGPDSRYTAAAGDVVKALPDGEIQALLKIGAIERAPASASRLEARQAELHAEATTERFENTVTGSEARAIGRGNRERMALLEEATEERPVEGEEG